MEYNYIQLSPVFFVRVHNMWTLHFSIATVSHQRVCTWLQQSYHVSVLLLNEIAWENVKNIKTLQCICNSNACKSETVDFPLFKRVFQFRVLFREFVFGFMKFWPTHFKRSVPLWINPFQLYWLISKTHSLCVAN